MGAAPEPEKKKKKKKAAADEEEAAEEEVPKKKKKAAAEEAEEDEAPKKAASGGDDDDFTVFVGGIPWSCDEATFKKDFAECGEIAKLNFLLNDEGKPKGIAFVKYASKEGLEAALKFDGTDYGGRTLKVNKAGDKGAKGKGDKGKGKG